MIRVHLDAITGNIKRLNSLFIKKTNKKKYSMAQPNRLINKDYNQHNYIYIKPRLFPIQFIFFT